MKRANLNVEQENLIWKDFDNQCKTLFFFPLFSCFFLYSRDKLAFIGECKNAITGELIFFGEREIVSKYLRNEYQ